MPRGISRPCVFQVHVTDVIVRHCSEQRPGLRRSSRLSRQRLLRFTVSTKSKPRAFNKCFQQMLSTHVQTPTSTSSCKRFKVTRHERRKFCKKGAWLNSTTIQLKTTCHKFNEMLVIYCYLWSFVVALPKRDPSCPESCANLRMSSTSFDIFWLCQPLRSCAEKLIPSLHVTMTSPWCLDLRPRHQKTSLWLPGWKETWLMLHQKSQLAAWVAER